MALPYSVAGGAVPASLGQAHVKAMRHSQRGSMCMMVGRHKYATPKRKSRGGAPETDKQLPGCAALRAMTRA